MVSAGALLFFAGAIIVYLFVATFAISGAPWGAWVVFLLLPGAGRDTFLSGVMLAAVGSALAIVGWIWATRAVPRNFNSLTLTRGNHARPRP